MACSEAKAQGLGQRAGQGPSDCFLGVRLLDTHHEKVLDSDVRQGGAQGARAPGGGAGRGRNRPAPSRGLAWPGRSFMAHPKNFGKSGHILVVFKAGLYRSNRELVNPGQNLKSGTTAPAAGRRVENRGKSRTILVEKAGLKDVRNMTWMGTTVTAP
jgi:hypothetical protein